MPSPAGRPLRLGYKASAEQFAPAELLRSSLLAEELGFDSVAISDHFQPFRHTGGHAPSAFPWLGALAARSERITIGTSVCTPTFRYSPAEVAHAFATLGCLAPGRVFLGVGTGESLNEVPPTGIEWPGGGERLNRLKEAVALIRELWTSDRVTFEGDFYKTLNATIYDKPETPVPIWIAAAAPKSSHYVGEAADGFITTSGKPSTLYTDTLIPAVSAGAESVGRSIGDIELMLEVKLSYAPTMDEARTRLQLLGAARAAGRDEEGRARPGRARAARRREPRARTVALHLHDRPRRGGRADPRLLRARLPPPRLPRAGRRSGDASCGASPPTSHRACARASRGP